MSPKNLSEELFKPRFKHPETSTLVRRLRHSNPVNTHSVLEGESRAGWYRTINFLLWNWRGLPPQESIEVLARIAASRQEHSDERLLDTVTGYRSGNWIYEWSKQAALWQQKAGESADDRLAAQYWRRAASLYSLAGYPYLKEDALAEQAQLLANRAWLESVSLCSTEVRELSFAIEGGGTVNGFLHMPATAKAPYPTVLLCASLDTLQNDHYRLYQDHFAPQGVAMLTIDAPSVGLSSRWKLTQDASCLHQQVLRQLEQVAWIDHTRVGAVGFRFGANIAVRLAYLEPQRLRGVACLGPVVHALLTDATLQMQLPEMYLDMLASRLGMSGISDTTLRAELSRFSLKLQGLLGRRCTVPMLSGFWPGDPYSPEEESRAIVNSSAQGRLLAIKPSPSMKNLERGLHDSCEWLIRKLCA